MRSGSFVFGVRSRLFGFGVRSRLFGFNVRSGLFVFGVRSGLFGGRLQLNADFEERSGSFGQSCLVRIRD